MLSSPAGKEPLGIQWNLRIPDGIQIAIEDVTAGDAAVAVDKTVTCAFRTAQGREQQKTLTCILVGGRKAIANGTAAVVAFRVDPRRAKGDAQVVLEKILGVGADLEGVAIADANGTLTIQ
jgi:hypothetical protein